MVRSRGRVATRDSRDGKVILLPTPGRLEGGREAPGQLPLVGACTRSSRRPLGQRPALRCVDEGLKWAPADRGATVTWSLECRMSCSASWSLEFPSEKG